MRLCWIPVFLLLVQHISCDDLYVVRAPKDAIQFSEKLSSVKANQLGSLLSAVSGVTSSKGAFDGVRVLSPFRYPRVVSLVTAVTEEGAGRLSSAMWRHLDVDGAVDADVAFHQLDKGLAKQANTLPAIKLQTEEEYVMSEAAANATAAAGGEGERFQQELALLEAASTRMASQLDGRRAVLVALHSLVDDAASAAQLTEAVERYAQRLAAASGDRAVTLLLTQPAHVRHARSLLQQAEEPESITRSSLNVASAFTGDYPVIFNILLITSLFLLYVLVAFSVMTAYMDPGKDSIIYRMTNPNMKKNN